MMKEKVIIVGASMAGLLAARVCADHFNQVLILEKDKLPDSPIPRKGIPQDQQLHLLLSKGNQIISNLFPGIHHDLVAEGAIAGDLGLLMQWYSDGGFRPQCSTGQETILMSRPLLEHTIRKRLLQRKNIRIKEQTRVFAYQQEQGRAYGLKTSEGEMEADLFIDTCGVASGLQAALEDWKYPLPRVEEVQVNVKYTSCLFDRPADFKGLININSDAPKNSKHGTIQAIEGDKMIVMVQGREQDQVPKDIDSLKQYTKQLEHPLIYETIRQLNPIGTLSHYHIPKVRWVHYEELDRFPAGLLVLGDAICRLNPVYGQGMSSAALQAEVLQEVLQKGIRQDSWKRYFRQIAKLLKNPWEVTLAEDFKFAGTQGQAPKIPKVIEKYFAKLSRVMNHDPVLFKAFASVVNLMKPPSSLLSPRLIWRVLRAR